MRKRPGKAGAAGGAAGPEVKVSERVDSLEETRPEQWGWRYSVRGHRLVCHRIVLRRQPIISLSTKTFCYALQ